jgi:arsenate reductase (thioredoxin)
MTEIKKKVLFVCTGNSVRSQMAEGLLKALGSGQWDVQSAGIIQSYVHPLAILVMKEISIDISKQTSKSLDQFLNEKFTYIITLCDHAAQFCPAFGGRGKRLHWPFEDPAGATGTTEERLAVFRRIRDEIKKKIEEFLKSESSEIPDAIASFRF